MTYELLQADPEVLMRKDAEKRKMTATAAFEASRAAFIEWYEKEMGTLNWSDPTTNWTFNIWLSNRKKLVVKRRRKK